MWIIKYSVPKHKNILKCKTDNIKLTLFTITKDANYIETSAKLALTRLYKNIKILLPHSRFKSNLLPTTTIFSSHTLTLDKIKCSLNKYCKYLL